MHTHLEIVIPPTDDIPGAVASVMKRFDENAEDEDGDMDPHAFWDFYVIGGRFAGSKSIAKYDQAKLDAFYAWLQSEKVTVSGITFGKQEISPADQIPKVDAKWNEMFPSDSFVKCPIFKHSNDQFAKSGPMSGTLPADVCRLVDVPPDMEIGHVIFAGPSIEKIGSNYEPVGALEAKFMLTDTAWNGTNQMKVDWTQRFPDALAKYRKSIEGYKPSYAAAIAPQDDWLVITVDYHS